MYIFTSQGLCPELQAVLSALRVAPNQSNQIGAPDNPLNASRACKWVLFINKIFYP